MSTVRSDASKHTVLRIVPMEREADIKRLFLENERPEFPGWFDRAYPIAVEKLGCTSWVTVDANDRVICHMSAFRASFWVDESSVDGTLFCNLMTDKGSRSFFPTVATIKAAVRDVREDGTHFIYSNPINKGSRAVLRAGGLRKVADENRYLLPTGHSRFHLDIAAATVLRLRHLSQKRVQVREVDPQEAVNWTIRNRCKVSNVTARRYPEVYYMRWNSLEGGETLGFVFLDRAGRAVGCTLVRTGEHRHARVITLRCLAQEFVGPCASALGLELRSRGIVRLDTSALEDTSFSDGLVRGGFIKRKDPWAIAATAFTPEGQAVVDELGSSDLEHIDVD